MLSSRPLDKGEAGLPKKFFRPFGPQFGLKLSGRGGEGGGPPGPSPGSATDLVPRVFWLFGQRGNARAIGKFCIPRRPRDEHDCEANAGHLLCTNKNKRR